MAIPLHDSREFKIHLVEGQKLTTLIIFYKIFMVFKSPGLEGGTNLDPEHPDIQGARDTSEADEIMRKKTGQEPNRPGEN